MYKGYKNKEENFKFFLSGKKDEELFQEINGRNKYINLINCVYLDSTRQLKQFLKKSKTNMIESYKSKRLAEEITEEITEDERIISTIDSEVNALYSNFEKISYINKSANFIKEEFRIINYIIKRLFSISSHILHSIVMFFLILF